MTENTSENGDATLPRVDVEICVECRIDDGMINHDCDEFSGDGVLLDPGGECNYCGYEAPMTDGGVETQRHEVREAHCQCCGGYAGHGPDPEYCVHCRSAGEHLAMCPMCEEEVPKHDLDEFCTDCEQIIEELDRLLEDFEDE